tara:strand:+ start:310 stop:1101 length:792 start_codon:yes stop_codon:yes gene_type:complete
MKITIFTSNQPRHISLIENLASIADQVYAFQECNTIFPGRVDDFFRCSNIMQKYFNLVIKAEHDVFGQHRFLPSNVKSLSVKTGDLNWIDLKILNPALQSDYYIIFGSSFIKSPLVDFLVNKKAINIHMGLSPYYRGSSCNFWALYDKRPEYVGATIHLLSNGLDSGPILFHAIPQEKDVNGFLLGMFAVKSAHKSLVSNIKSKKILKINPIIQDKKLEIRYSRRKDFNDKVASDYLNDLPSIEYIKNSLDRRDNRILLGINS